MRSCARIFIATSAALLLIGWQLYASAHIHAFFGDFRAFYCAASALAHGANPYAAAAIYPCESSPMPFGLYQATPGVAVPAPLPGYALAALLPLTLMPYVPACAFWLVLVLFTFFFAARALAQLLAVPFDRALWTLAAGFAVISVPFGELGTVIVAALLWMAGAIRRDAWTQAAAAAAVAAILPHVALPALLGAFFFIPQMRARLFIAGIALIALDVAGGGHGIALAYVRDVLPAHARSEIGSTAQYGLTWMLHALGAPDRLAIAGGEYSYAFMTLLGLIAGRAMMKRTGDRAYAILLPPAFAVFGGTFMHYTQIMIAIPAALLIARHGSGRARAAACTAILLLVVPWAWVLGQPVLVPVYAAVCGFVAAALLRFSVSAALRVSLCAALLSAVIVAAGAHFGSGLPAHAHGIAFQGGLAQSSWEAFVRSQRASTGAVWWIAKAPTWLGLLALTLSCAHVLVKKDLVTPVLVEQVPVTA